MTKSAPSPRYFAFLRAINVGGHVVTMETLRRLFDAAGCTDVETFIASGNVIFRSSAKDIDTLRKAIERRLEASLGYAVDTFIRSEAELAAVARYAPFSAARRAAARALNVAFLVEPLPRSAEKTIKALETDVDAFQVNGREVYWLCAMSQSDSKFNNVVFERTLKTRATWRNINTVMRLAAKYQLGPQSS